MGDLSNTASDIVGGLRVLRGIGGEQVFHDRYRRESQATRRAGVQVAKLQSVLDALQVFLPGVFVVRRGLARAPATPSTGRITPGELVAFYGYSAFLMIPLRTATEYANKIIRARVSARRVCRVLALTPDVTDPATPAPSPPAGSELYDVRTGLRVRAGTLTAIVSEQPDESAALADRLGPVRRRGRRRRAPRRRTPRPRCGAPRSAAGSSSPTPARRCSPAGSATGSTSRGTGDVARGARHRLGRRHPRGAARRPRHRGRRARPHLLRRPAAAAGAGAGAHRRPGDPRAGRADLRRRRPHRGPDRGPAARRTAPAAPPS